MDPFIIKQGDRLPSIEATLSAAGGKLTTLAGATVYFVLADAKTGVRYLRAPAVVVGSPTDLKVRYDWAANDTSACGTYKGEFEVVIGGKPWTFPNPGYIPVVVNPDLG